MAPDQLRRIIRTTPFRPFTVELGSGTRISVKHSDYVFLSPAGRTLMVYDDNDAAEIIDVFLITNVSVEGINPVEV